jgi:hypothetical protein
MIFSMPKQWVRINPNKVHPSVYRDASGRPKKFMRRSLDELGIHIGLERVGSKDEKFQV